MEPLVGPSTFQSRHLVRWRRCDQITNDYQTHRRDAALGNGALTALVVVRLVPAVVLVVGVIDLASAALTVWALAGEAAS